MGWMTIRNWKIVVPAVLLAAVLLLAVLAAGPVRRTTFRLAQPGGDEECQLTGELRSIDGVLGMRLEAATGELLVDHGPQVEPRQLAQVLARGGHDMTLLGSRRILPMHALAFPAGHEIGCRRLTQCPAGEAWRELLGWGKCKMNVEHRTSNIEH